MSGRGGRWVSEWLGGVFWWMGGWLVGGRVDGGRADSGVRNIVVVRRAPPRLLGAP